MGQPAAKQNDIIQAMDTHIVMVPSPGGPVPTPTPGHPFNGIVNGGLSTSVRIMGLPAATVGSTANNQPPHIPIGGPSFQIPPTNHGTILTGSATVRINGQPAARNGDTANTCNDPAPLPVGTVIASGTVMIGG
jgi:uncharacterized Zn-binding protein involved in type VI secretion